MLLYSSILGTLWVSIDTDLFFPFRTLCTIMLPLIKAELLQPCAFGFVIRTRNQRRLRLCVEFSKYLNNFHCRFAVVKETMVGLLIWTLISENQGLEKLRSVSNLRKISDPPHLFFFQFVTFLYLVKIFGHSFLCWWALSSSCNCKVFISLIPNHNCYVSYYTLLIRSVQLWRLLFWEII